MKTSNITLAIIATLYTLYNVFNGLLAVTVMQQQVYALNTLVFILFCVMWILVTNSKE